MSKTYKELIKSLRSAARNGSGTAQSGASTVYGEKGDKGDTGDAAGFGEPTAKASRVGTSEDPTVKVTASGPDTAKVFAFEFGIPQGLPGQNGQNGKDGAAAGFGEITAEAETLEAGSEATATVTASGEDTAKSLAFRFGIPRGAKGSGGAGGAEVIGYADFLDLASKDAETLYAVTYGGNADIFLGSTRITRNITEVLPDAITVEGSAEVTGGSGATAAYTASFSPSDTTEMGLKWSLTGSAATIDAVTGLLTASGRGLVTVAATSISRPSVSGSKPVSVNESMAVTFSGQGFGTSLGSTYKCLILTVDGTTKYTLMTDYDGKESGTVNSTRVSQLSAALLGGSSFALGAATSASGTVTAIASDVPASALQSIVTAWDAVAASVAVDCTAGTVTTYLTATPATVNVAADRLADTEEITIRANQSWTAAVAAGSWLSIVSSYRSGTGDKVITGYANAANETSSTRSGIIRITGADGTTVDIRVTQAAAEAEVVNPSIDSTSFVLSGEGASRTLNVSDPQSRGWRLTSSAAWATLSQSSGTGAAEVTVTAAASTSTTTTRTGYVYLWDSTGATKLATLTLTQAPTSVVALTGLAISGEDTGDYGVYLTAVYTPSDTTQTGVQWSIVSGSDYASIGANEGGDEITVTINPVGNVGKTFTVRCTSTANSAIYAEKTITIVEGTVADWSIAGPTALTAYSSEEYQYSVDWGDIIEQDVTWSVENAGTSAYPYATINSSTGVLKQGLKAYQMSSGSSGTFQVRATLADGEYKEIDVTITKK